MALCQRNTKKGTREMNEPSYFGLTNDHTWLSVDEEYYKKLKPTHRMKCYTHPAKTLTDEEIIKTMVQFDVYSSDDHCLIEAGRAILRKAQEK